MKFFLLIAGHNYYPLSATGDWIACYETYEEAYNQVKEHNDKFVIDRHKYDWYEIVNLADWIK